MPLSTGAELTELATDELATDERLDDTAAAELDERLEAGAALDAGVDEVAVPQADAVNCALFLPTPAYCANLSFTHCGVTGE